MGETGTREHLWDGRAGPFTLLLSDRVFAPTHTSREVAAGIDIQPGETVFDVGCGSGVLSFVAARLGAGLVIGTDVNEEAVVWARRNAERLGLAHVVDFRAGSLFEPLGDARADVVIGDVSGIPDEIAALTDWFPGGFSGGPTGAEIPIAMLETADRHLRPGGRMYLPTASLQDEETVLGVARRMFGERIGKLGERLFPLPTKIAEHPIVRRLMDSGVVTFFRRGSRWLWRLRVWECRLPGVADDALELGPLDRPQ
jgi:SAM-dependent methyltransferase